MRKNTTAEPPSVFTDALTSLLPHPAVWLLILAGIAAAVTAIIWGRRRRSMAGAATAAVAVAPDEAREISEYWEPLAKAADDRRDRHRRTGGPVAVDLIGPEGDKPRRAFVLDRSPTGLRLAVDRPLKVSGGIRLLTIHAPSGTPWIRAVVRWCRPEGDHYEAGCHFTEQPEWNVLLLFG